MRKTLSFFFRHILTGRDNRTYDVARVGMLAGIVVVCAQSLWGMLAAGNADSGKLGELMKSFSVAIANILGWGSVGCAAKSHTEPPPATEPKGGKPCSR